MTRELDVADEQLFPFAELAKEVPGRRGNGVTSSTLWRWSHGGVRLSDGSVIRLEFRKIGARLLTSREAIKRLLAAIDADAKAGLVTATN